MCGFARQKQSNPRPTSLCRHAFHSSEVQRPVLSGSGGPFAFGRAEWKSHDGGTNELYERLILYGTPHRNVGTAEILHNNFERPLYFRLERS